MTHAYTEDQRPSAMRTFVAFNVGLFVFLAACGSLSSHGRPDGLPKDESHYSPRYILTWMERSKVAYDLHETDPADITPAQFADELWPKRLPELELPARNDGRAPDELVEFDVGNACLRRVADTEALVRAGQWVAVREECDSILADQPRCYPALLRQGDAAWASSDAAAALPHFQRALAMNPFDHRTHVRLARALLATGEAARAHRVD